MIPLQGFPIWGDTSFRGDCPLEGAELITLINHMSIHYPDLPILHIKNEGRRTYRQSVFERSIGALHKGACDIIVLANPTICIELKRLDHTKSTISKEQILFLRKCIKQGCIAGVALGHQAAIQTIISHVRPF